jgi:hypothetical protein
MRWVAIPIIALVLVGTLQSKARYFLAATLVSVEQTNAERRYTINAPSGIFIVRCKQIPSGRLPRISGGEIRVSVAKYADVGDPLYLLDTDGKEYKAKIVERRRHPPPPVVH